MLGIERYIFMQLGFSVSNWQKVQLNNDLFSDKQKYLYTVSLALLNIDSINGD